MRYPRRQIGQVFWLCVVTMMAVFFQNCGISRPSVEDPSFGVAQFSHTGNEISCSTCHETGRPQTTTGFIGLNTATPFDYFSHGSGFDCISCHNPTSVGFRVRADWSPGNFNHPVTTSSCVVCHSSQRPTVAVNGFDHNTSGTGDCVNCHQKSLSSSFTSMADWAGGAGATSALVYDTSHDITLSAQIPTYVATSIQSLTTQSQNLHMAMRHTTTSIDAATLGTCNICHAGAAQGAYFPGVMHDSLTAAGVAQPSTCNDCHGSALPIGFVGPVNTTRSPQSPAMKHNAVVWTNSGTGFSATATALVTSDCTVCHQVPPNKTDWTGGIYHASLGLSQPSSCLDCHANSRPNGVVPATPVANFTSYDHINGGGTGDCVSCHTSKTIWSSGKYHATSGTQSTCIPCHSSERPISSSFTIGGATSNFAAYDSTNKPFDLTTHGDSLDCVKCHSSPPANATVANWQSGVFNHAAAAPILSCVNCHSSQRPGNSAADLTKTGGFDHTVNGLGDCVGCHQTALSSNFSQMSNWASGATVPTALVGSHKFSSTLNTLRLNLKVVANPVTATNVASTTVIPQPSLLQQMLHTAIPAAVGSGNCVLCHSGYPTSYTGGVFHSKLTAGQNSAITNCNVCHIGSLPSDIIDIAAAGTTLGTGAIRPMNHLVNLNTGKNITKTANSTGVDTGLGTYDCSQCHHQPGVAGGFNDGKFHYNATGNATGVASTSIANCTSCHYVIMPNSSTPINKMTHISVQMTQDCSVCHSAPSTAAQITSPASTNWNSATFHNHTTAKPTACIDCHSAQAPAATTVSNNNSQYMSHTSNQVSGQDCAQCHSGDVAAGVTPTAWSKSDSFHTSVSATTCKECHGLSNGSAVAGTGNNLPAALTNSHNLTTASAGSGVSGQYDRITHTATDVAGKDCTVCHTVAGSTIPTGKISPAWNNAKFHANVTTITGQCATCHTNLKPSSVVSGMDHSTITSDCAGCHTYPGTGIAGTTANWLGAANGGPHTVAFLNSNATTCVSCHAMGGQLTAPVGAPLIINIAKSSTTATPASGAPALGTTGINFYHTWQATTNGTSANSFTMCLGCHATGASNNAAVNALGPNLDGMGVYAPRTATVTGLYGWGPSFSVAASPAVTATGTFNHKIPTAITYNSTTRVATVTTSTNINSCLPCHAIDGAGHGSSNGHSIFKPGGCATGKSPQDCATCHKTTQFTSWSNPSGGTATCK